ncbi:MAG: cytochrome C oxidase subunit IV family protein [Rhodocyclaceae bacterium]|jgi:heme/copper-type cytochrome/quinol oxidase subunit 4|nr:cytochrome C oxidase subunit IV family protein [Rhodocyclaceae bacterium]
MGLWLGTPTLVWAVLMLATCASTWWLKSGAATSMLATAAILVIAAVKVRLVIIHFMELGDAPLKWRIFFELWVIVFSGVILAGFWLSAH